MMLLQSHRFRPESSCRVLLLRGLTALLLLVAPRSCCAFVSNTNARSRILTESLVETSSTGLIGSFRIGFNGELSIPLSSWASSSDVATALMTMSSIEDHVTVENFSSPDDGVMEWLVTFSDSAGNLGDFDLDLSELSSTDPTDSLSHSVVVETEGELSNGYGATFLYSDATNCGSYHLFAADPFTVRDETKCSGGIDKSFAIIAEAKSPLSGSFDIFFEGMTETIELSATAGDVQTLLRSLSVALEDITVEERTYEGTMSNGRTLLLRYPATLASTEELVICDKWTMGSNARVDIYPVLSFAASADLDDISGDYTIHLGDEATPSIAMTATEADIMEVLHQLIGIGKVISLGEQAVPPVPPLIGFDYKFAVVAHTADLDSFHITPETNWSGTDSRIFFSGPKGQVPLHTVIEANDSSNHQVRVSAHNGQGYGLPSPATTVAPANMPPGVPQGVRLGDYVSANELSLTFQPPVQDGGDRITKYKVEWSTASHSFTEPYSDEITTVNEQQEVILSCRSRCHGTFSLSWGGRVSGPIAVSATALDLEAHISSLLGGEIVRVSRRSQGFGYRWLVTFSNTPGNLGEMVADGHWLYGGGAQIWVEEVVPGSADIFPGSFTSEVQAVYVNKLPGFGGSATTTTGSFRLSFEGVTTADIDVSASANEMKEALEALGSVYTVNVVRGENFSGQVGWTITFTHLIDEGGHGAGDIDLLRVVDSSLSDPSVTSIKVFENIRGTDPLIYTIGGLTSGQEYFARVSAQNRVGWSKPSAVTRNTSAPVAIPMTQPGAPLMANVSIPPDQSGTALDVAWLPPRDDGGDAVTGYRVEYYSSLVEPEIQKVSTSSTRGVKDVQTIRTAADSNSISGFFAITFNGEQTEPIPFNAPAGTMESKLERLSTIGDVTVSQDFSQRPVRAETFVLTNGSASIGRGESSSTDLTAIFSSSDIIFVGTERHIVVSTSPTTIVIDEAYSGPTSSDVHIDKWAYGFEWTVTFESHVGEQPLMQLQAGENWAGENPTLSALHTRRGLYPLSGTFQLSFDGERTKALPWNARATDMKAALDDLQGLGSVDVVRYPNAQGYNWFVTFQDGGGNIPLLGVFDNMLNGPNAKAEVVAVSEGAVRENYGSIEVTGSPLQSHYTITGLSRGIPYYIDVRCKNSQGYGPSLTALPAPLSPKTLPNPPENAVALPLSNKEILVRWQPPSNDGGSPIQKFKIEWDSSDSYENSSSPGLHTFVDGREESYVVMIDPLSSYIPCYIRLSAYNGYGWSPFLQAEGSPIRAALQEPAKVFFEARATSAIGAMLTWSPPHSGGSTLDGYLIEVYEVV